MDTSTERLLWMYETMIVIRRYEETMAQVYLEGKLPPAIQKGLAFDIVPLDVDTVLASVRKTGRLLVADEDYLGFGLSGEIAALVAERLDGVVPKAPVRRLAVPGVPIPYSRPLEQAVIPSPQRIVDACRKLVDTRIAVAA